MHDVLDQLKNCQCGELEQGPLSCIAYVSHTIEIAPATVAVLEKFFGPVSAIPDTAMCASIICALVGPQKVYHK